MAIIPTTMGARLRVICWLLATAMLLLGILLQAQALLMPAWLEPVGHALYRIVFWLLFPLSVLLRTVSAPIDHHWPLWNWVLLCFAAPVIFWGIVQLRRRRVAQRTEDSSQLSRRRFMCYAGGAVGTAGLGLGVYASGVEPLQLRVRRYDVAIDDLPDAICGLTIVQVSDTHYGRYVTRRFIGSVIDEVNALRPDLVVLTGDYIHGTSRAIEPGIRLFSRLQPKLGSYAVLGNHDHWENAATCRQALLRAGVELIENRPLFFRSRDEKPSIRPSATRCLCLAGVGDLWEGEVSLDKAFANASPGTPRLLLSHNPDLAERITATTRIDLMLSGHTHGGQVRLPGLGTPLIPSAYGAKYAGGLVSAPHCRVLVSRGVGLSVLPVRFGVPPEISLLKLVSRESAREANL